MIRFFAIAIAAALVAAPELADAQNKSPVSASRFGISIDGVQKPKAKGLKSQSGKKGGSGVPNYKLENAWPK